MKPTKSQIAGWERRADAVDVIAEDYERRGLTYAASKDRQEAINLRRAAETARREMEQETT